MIKNLRKLIKPIRNNWYAILPGVLSFLFSYIRGRSYVSTIAFGENNMTDYGRHPLDGASASDAYAGRALFWQAFLVGTAVSGGMIAAKKFIFDPYFRPKNTDRLDNEDSEVKRISRSVDVLFEELDRTFETIARLQKKYYTEKGQEINRLLEGFSKEQLDKMIAEVDSFWVCPITKEIIREPIRPADNKTYERCALQQWYDNDGQVCPYDRRLTLSMPTEMAVDEALQDRIISFLDARLDQQNSHSNRRV